MHRWNGERVAWYSRISEAKQGQNLDGRPLRKTLQRGTMAKKISAAAHLP